MRKNSSSDREKLFKFEAEGLEFREKLLKFEAEGREFFKIFANSRASASNLKSFSRSLEQIVLAEGQNNYGNKIP